MKTKKTTQQVIDKFFKSGKKGTELFNRFYKRKEFNFKNLSDIDLSDMNLSDMNFTDVNFTGVNFTSANFTRANFTRANFADTNFTGTNTNITINELTLFIEIVCPSEGSFIGWKKAKNYIVKLKICEDALRSSATSHKCRCSKVEVLAIENIDKSPCEITSISSDFNRNFIYEVGKIIEVKDFDTNRWNECSTGIHFFISRKLAECYV